jgi:hypothetical protein
VPGARNDLVQAHIHGHGKKTMDDKGSRAGVASDFEADGVPASLRTTCQVFDVSLG